MGRPARRCWLLVVCLSALCSILSVGGSFASTCDWTGAVDDDWVTAANWSNCGGTTPGASDSATITSTANQPLIDSAASVILSSLSIGSGATVTVSGSLTLGDLSGDGLLDVAGDLTWTSGTWSGSGTTTIEAGGQLTISGSTTRNLDTRTLETHGTTTWSGGTIHTYHAPAIVNDGTWDIQGDQDLVLYYTPTATFTNSGTIQKTSGSAETLIQAGLANSGSVSAASGTLTLGSTSASASSSSGAFTASSGATLGLAGDQTFTASSSITIPTGAEVSFSTGTQTLAGTLDVSGTTRIDGADLSVNVLPAHLGDLVVDFGTVALTASGSIPAASVTINNGSLDATSDLAVAGAWSQNGGTLKGAGNVDVTGAASWTKGSLTGSGTLATNGGLTISGSTTRNLDTRTLETHGTTTWSGGTIHTYHAPAIVNDGIWDIQGDQDLVLYYTPTATFTNSGTIQKTSGSAETLIQAGLENPGGAIEVLAGTLIVGHPSHTMTVSQGSFSAPGGLLSFVAGASGAAPTVRSKDRKPRALVAGEAPQDEGALRSIREGAGQAEQNAAIVIPAATESGLASLAFAIILAALAILRRAS
ncbi:MAG TPA: hypothetical protein VKA53_00735 [Thermoanaerobaculia bacterium]|nr:hypothetical protein [Thermoanaerobaculia bacterium]